MCVGGGGRRVCMVVTHEEDLLCAKARSIGVLFCEGDALFGEALSFLGFGVCGGDGFVQEEGSDEVAKQCLAMRGLASQHAVLGDCHCCASGGGRAAGGGGGAEGFGEAGAVSLVGWLGAYLVMWSIFWRTPATMTLRVYYHLPQPPPPPPTSSTQLQQKWPDSPASYAPPTRYTTPANNTRSEAPFSARPQYTSA